MKEFVSLSNMIKVCSIDLREKFINLDSIRVKDMRDDIKVL